MSIVLVYKRSDKTDIDAITTISVDMVKKLNI